MRSDPSRWEEKIGSFLSPSMEQEQVRTLFSTVETAKANGLNPYFYLRLIFEELPKAETLEQVEALTPKWQYPNAKAIAVPTSSVNEGSEEYQPERGNKFWMI